jgi:hypothetical protein
MRILVAVAILASGIAMADSPSTQAQGRFARAARVPCYAAVQPPYVRVARPCRAWRYRYNFNPNDPVGEFRGFPGWAQRAFTDPRN